MTSLFPEEFADIELVAGPWAIDADDERYSSRLAAGHEELQRFHDAVFPTAPRILDYCRAFDLRNAPAEVRALLNVLYSLISVSAILESGLSLAGSRRQTTAVGKRRTAMTGRRSHPTAESSTIE